jgi:hypothetical protein
VLGIEPRASQMLGKHSPTATSLAPDGIALSKLCYQETLMGMTCIWGVMVKKGQQFLSKSNLMQ